MSPLAMVRNVYKLLICNQVDHTWLLETKILKFRYSDKRLDKETMSMVESCSIPGSVIASNIYEARE